MKKVFQAICFSLILILFVNAVAYAIKDQKIITPEEVRTAAGSEFSISLNIAGYYIIWSDTVNCKVIFQNADSIRMILKDAKKPGSINTVPIKIGGVTDPPPQKPRRTMFCPVDDLAEPPTPSEPAPPVVPLEYSSFGADWVIIKPLDAYFYKGSRIRLLSTTYDEDYQIVLTRNGINCHAVYGGYVNDERYGLCHYTDIDIDNWGTASIEMKRINDEAYSKIELFVGPDFGNPSVYAQSGLIDKTKNNYIIANYLSYMGISLVDYMVIVNSNASNPYCLPNYTNKTSTSAILHLNPTCTYTWVDVAIKLSKEGTQKIYHKTYKGSTLKSASMEEDNEMSGITIFPNPSDELLTVLLPDFETSTIKIMDITGRVLVNNQINTSAQEISTKSYSSGIYYIQIELDGNTVTKKIVVQH